MKNPPSVITFIWHRNGEATYEGAVLVNEIVAVSPADSVIDEDVQCRIYLRGIDGPLDCIESAETVIKRWLDKLLEDTGLRLGWNLE